MKFQLALALALSSHALLAADDAPKAPLPSGVQAVELPGIHNAFQLADTVYSGSTPEGDAAFAALAERGVKTIISVDGAKPDVAAAKKHGLRYIHLPHGYDGVPFDITQQLAKAGATVPGPVFVHCHHGKHRGPAAAAVLCRSLKQWSPQTAEDFLKAAGTSPQYAGLYETVRAFQPLSAPQIAALPTKLPEVAETSALVDGMVAIDEVWDRLKAWQKKPGSHAAGRDAVLLWEHYRELQRASDVQQLGEKFLAAVRDAEVKADALRTLLAPEPQSLNDALAAAFAAAGKSCTDCHKAHRDPAKK